VDASVPPATSEWRKLVRHEPLAVQNVITKLELNVELVGGRRR